MPLLDNKVVFVTGGANGIGQECATAYAREGAKVIVADIDRQGAEESAHLLGSESIGLFCDVADGASVSSAVAAAESHFGRIDAVHNNAGIVNAIQAA